MKEVLKKLNNKKIIVDTVIFIILIVFAVIFLKKNITSLERIKLEETSNNLSSYYEELLTEDKDKYLNFALEYLYNTSDNEEYTVKEVLDFINNTFSKQFTEKDILDLGITPTMQSKGIMYNSSNNSFRYYNDLTVADIANKQIIYFKIDKISKVNENKFKIKYNKFIIGNPYDVLNYYNNYNLENENKVDITDIVEYLKGNKKIGAFKNIIKNEKKSFGKEDGSIEVIYIINDGKLLIDRVK